MSADELYAKIKDKCEYGYLLTDSEYGFAMIRREDVSADGEGRFVIQFRLPHEMGRVGLDRVAEEICRELGCEKEVYVKIEREYGIPFLDCAWIIDLSAKVDWLRR